MSFLFTLIVGDGTRFTRPMKLLGNIVRHPIKFLKCLWPGGWGRRTVVLPGHAKPRQRDQLPGEADGWFGRGVSLTTEQDLEKPNPTYIDVGNKAAEWLAGKTGGIAQSMVLEAVANIPTTAHLFGGAVIGRDASTGVDRSQQPRVRIPEPSRVRRRGASGKPRREPLAHHYRNCRTSDGRDSARQRSIFFYRRAQSSAGHNQVKP